MFPSPAYRPIFFFFFFAGVEKSQEDDVLKNDFEKGAATGPMEADVIVCFAN